MVSILTEAVGATTALFALGEHTSNRPRESYILVGQSKGWGSSKRVTFASALCISDDSNLYVEVGKSR